MKSKSTALAQHLPFSSLLPPELLFIGELNIMGVVGSFSFRGAIISGEIGGSALNTLPVSKSLQSPPCQQ